MKKIRPILLLLITIGITATSPAFSQVQCNLLQASNATAGAHAYASLSGLGFYSIYKASKGA